VRCCATRRRRDLTLKAGEARHAVASARQRYTRARPRDARSRPRRWCAPRSRRLSRQGAGGRGRRAAAGPRPPARPRDSKATRPRHLARGGGGWGGEVMPAGAARASELGAVPSDVTAAGAGGDQSRRHGPPRPSGRRRRAIR
jgi:hypothetical protein